jgi:hypothetical protein
MCLLGLGSWTWVRHCLNCRRLEILKRISGRRQAFLLLGGDLGIGLALTPPSNVCPIAQSRTEMVAMKRENSLHEVVYPGLLAKEMTRRSTTRILSFLLGALSWDYTSAEQISLPCSIRPKSGTPAQALPALAIVHQADAERTAVASLNAATPTRVTEGELELEQGCLVYSFDIKVSGRDGVEEVLIDAGTGAILSHVHESAQGEAAERAKEKKAPQ